ncbi:MAG: hypothetical protein EB127_14765 [Alphaproteobacteria bacterium]|nr:hypothetical protein [Alphaproteobacteria bacterium]
MRYAAQNAKSPQKPKEYVGVKGEKITLPVTIVKTKTKANPHNPLGGTMQYIKMEDESGNIIVWFNAGRPVEATEGKKVVVSGTVSQHSIFAGSKVTHIKRAKIN